MVAVAAWSETRTVLRPERGIFAKMKIFLPLVVWLVLLFRTASSQYSASRKNVGIFGLKHEVFFLNLEDGYFGCQVNESTDYLQLYELSKLCDGTSDCYMGSDELRNKLKCTNDCDKDGTACSNGACLEGQCHCNDGFGGCNCQVPDENECKYRPCDVFAHCTNTLGSFTCTCFPGYRGDGFQCVDIDECQDPAIAARCVDNAECCNLPAHFVCKCKSGFEGDGEERCTDINECLDPQACGVNAECVNVPGNYTCLCRDGFVGDPYNGCADVDECAQPGVCGPGAICTNVEGGYRCDCPAGFDGDARSAQGCADFDECTRSPCGRNALCRNDVGSFRCECPEGFHGDAMTDCQDVNECLDNPCGENAICTDTVGSFVCSCKPEYTGDPFRGCVDIDECTAFDKPCGNHAICENANPGYNCLCPQGYAGKPDPKIACEQADVNVLCKSNFDCTNNAECIEGQCFCQDGFEPQGSSCVDIDECRMDAHVCGPSAMCINTPGSFRCDCEAGFIGTPPRIQCKTPCADVKCGKNAYCKAEGQEAFCICEEGWTFNPNDISAGCVDINECDPGQGPNGRCGVNAACTNLPGSFSCQCPPGFTGDASRQCYDVDECSKPNACGEGAVCKNLEGSHQCSCPEGSIADPDPSVRCITIVTCTKDNDCPGNAICDAEKRCLCPEPNVGNDCRHPCENTACGPNSHCMLVNGAAQCLCSEGFTGHPSQCVDINECAGNPCPSGAICSNLPGGYTCQCPGGSSGDPYSGGCSKSALNTCNDQNPCPAGEKCIQDAYSGNSVCICGQGYKRNAKGVCKDINECKDPNKPACGVNAICKNLPGSYECQCPPGFNGNPFLSCEECSSLECKCPAPYKFMDGNCVLDSCSTDGKCAGGAECITITGGVSYCACPKGFRTQADGKCEDIDECSEGQQVCGYDAICMNTIGGYECKCPLGYSGDPYNGLCALAQKRCSADRECNSNEKCVQPGECVCPPPFYMDAYDGNKCKSPCERFPCGINARCTPTDPPQCMCEVGYKGDPLTGCTDEDECANSPCAYGAQCVNQKGGYKCVCPRGLVGDAYKGGCILEEGSVKSQCRRNQDCADTLACERGTCVSPCSSLLCGPNAYCEPEKHAAWCRCRVGFVEGPNGDCVSQCNGYMCGQGAICIVTNSGPTCKCPPGEMGNPFPGGSCVTDQCSANRPCIDPQVCINGRCKHKCDGVVCGIGATCDGATGKCICEPFFVGNPEMLCMPPITTPSCEPECGQNAHCEYGVVQNTCVCNPGTSGNPYGLCETKQRNTCSSTSCGANAQCRETLHGVECVCPNGFIGNPYVQCKDIDECSTGNVCGEGALCINSAGSFDCRCKPGLAGNPFTMCSPMEKNMCDNPRRCQCGKKTQCPPGYTCERGSCKDLCAKTTCGPRAACDSGKCVCPPGYTGNPKDLRSGCVQEGQCDNDADCKNKEICFQYGKGVRKCVDACSKLQCGPNALCVSDDHRSTCICASGYVGSPGDLTLGCQREATKIVEGCKDDSECSGGKICALTETGLRSCVNPCSVVECGVNEVCKADEHNNPICHCQDGFVWNPVASACEKPSIPDCTRDEDCHQVAACRQDVLGILKCTPVCAEFTCPANSVCVSSNHRGSCQCLPGYTGNPNDRNGCRPELQNKCLTSAECAESDACVQHDGALRCRPACENIQCGPHAICISNNHNGQCQCPPGSYAGDPYDLKKGCQSVPCVYNNDCPPTQMCNRMTHTCFDICTEDTCGENAVCIAENHRSLCQCPPGYKANPIADVECTPLKSCDPSPCHPSAICEAGPDGHICKCPAEQVGDPMTGCRPEGACPNGDLQCPENAACVNGKCVDPCTNACGINSKCTVINRTPVCSCKAKYVPGVSGTARDGCVRLVSECLSDLDCGGDVCQNGQCMVVCRNTQDCSGGERCVNNVCTQPCSSHTQCGDGQACIAGSCLLGCRSNKDCDGTKACINSKCKNPCETEGACGPNAICSCINHITTCKCPAGFEGNPIPEQGCVRMPASCTTSTECAAGHMCIANQCNLPCSENTACAVGERCHNNICAKVCYTNNNCLPGEVCNEAGTCQPGCSTDTDCPSQKICLASKCKCMKGFIGTPFGCTDIDECTDSPCHESALCENIPGSYRCACPEGTVGDAYSNPGCRLPNQCYKNADCAENLACVEGKCKDPCQTVKCGANAECQIVDHEATCQCPSGHLGDARDQTVGCFRVECLTSEDCGLERQCHSESNKCINPCEFVDCGKGACHIENHEAICTCFQGYDVIGGRCEDMDECQTNPCHASATCQNTPGSYTCSCPEGLVGDPINSGCRSPDECITNSDCPTTAICEAARCKNPCDVKDACGQNAVCSAVAHAAVCECAPNSRGNPKKGCTKIECSEANDCSASQTCIRYKCVDPCSLTNACGQSATCVSENHLAICSCQPGTTGNPLLGCVPLQYCNSDQQCPAGTKCSAGVCSALCSTNRECISDQLCIQGVCQPTCKTNSSCPDFQFCQNNICTQEFRCRTDDDCDIDENCVVDSTGRSECINACSGRTLCGRNAECSARDHSAVCDCKPGYYQDKSGTCRKIECQSDEDCSSDKTCENHTCKIACLIGEPCGANALCSAENHKQVCYCQPGFTGDPKTGCNLIDFCKQSPCGPNAKCRNSRGSYRCSCSAGLVGDPYNTGCKKAAECETNADCPDNAECSQAGGEPKCRDVCESVQCSPNAECQPRNHQAVCQCRSGYEGNPTDLLNGCKALPLPCKLNNDCPEDSYCYGQVCKPACTATEECNQDEVCAKGQCVNPCQEAGSACGMNAECRMAGHFKQCSCPAGFTGDPALECVRVPVLCGSSADCAPGMGCHESMCLPRCGADQECALNEKCIGGQCMLTCRLDNDCFLGHICLNGRCVYGCHSDDDCGASETCRNNRCTDPCRDSPCGPNAACTVVNHRASCSCINGMVPSPTAKIGCIRAPALQCTENRDCTDGTSCIENVCRPICANDQGCLNNERCDRGTCKPICRRDDDCRTGEVCQGQTCMIGCRSNAGCPAELACVNQQCVDPCQEPTACGTNAICTVANHRKQCVCPAPLVGDPLVGCRAEERSCQARSDCAKGQACYGNTCMQTCRNDQNCLADERCIRGTCRTVCNSDASCSNGLICENRICQTGCRTDNNCPNNQACINKQCTDPCTVLGQCGSCSECTVVNHGVQCSCPSGYLGNPLVSCAPPPQKCNSYCYCDEEGIYCADKCRLAKDCACGQTCQRGRCRAKCNPGSCPAGQLCQNGACMAGCRSNADCPGERSCTNKKCIDPCAGGKACGKNAICQVADHQALCLCPDGFQGDPREGCVQYECQTNEDCELDKKCVAGKCTNPCLEHDACGLNAQCRVVNRQAQCSCTPGFFGNARQECQPLQKHSCSQNPCGENTVCREDANGYECTCQPGCMGDPRQGCLCEGKQTNKCHEFPCGKKAVCRITAYDQPECYCPPLYPGGDPYVECTNERTVTDCRTTGCAEGECVRDGTQFICRNDESCANDMQCPNEKACIGGKCSDPCSLRGACGDNALCQTVLHRPRCSCPSCYIGRPNVECKPDPKCKEATTQKPSDPKIVSIACEKDADCDESLRCDASGQCNDPCTIPTTYVCDPNKKCISRRHRPVCVCKHGFIVNDYGELICAPEKRECHGDDGCASNMACIDGKCLNPCMPTATRGPACPEDKACMVMDHKPACVCMKDCSPTLSICLRDSGCPSDLACRNYQCVNPCESTQCADDTPCFVEDHKPICKFCPPGFVKDAHQGCLKGNIHHRQLSGD